MTAVAPHTGYTTSPGRAHPLGARPDAEGVNFSLYSQNATSVQLLLFATYNDPEPMQVITLDEAENRTFHFWHVYVRGPRPGVHYAYRVDGPRDLHGAGHRFNPNKVLVDPYAHGNTSRLWDPGAACGPEDNLATSMRSVVIDVQAYDWEGDAPLNRPMEQSIIYELHVRGFTASPTGHVLHPGTFDGLVEKIPYLQSLGVTAVELLPVFDFDELEFTRENPAGGSIKNFWGYSTVGYFAPNNWYCVAPETGKHLDEFRDLVRAMHRAGIEVILDVVFNHTAEGNHEGPTISFKGIDNQTYYFLVPEDKQYYRDFSGCGNTLSCNRPIVEKIIVDCLEFWVRDCHVDGFRFDEGSILTRDEDGRPMEYPPVVWQIELSEQLLDTKVIAEAWDAAGLYQIGIFPGHRWAEWNDRFRDDVRRFVRGDPGVVGAVAARIAGSADLYQTSGQLPVNSINFVTCHDGFTLDDLVSYNDKHNEANGEGNRDGRDENLSWNCSIEGPTDDPAIEALRNRQVKNFAALLLLSQGVPMFVAGDEFRRTQQGNNNAYCQDNEISWVDWTLLEKHQDVFRFFRTMIAFRKAHPVLHRRHFFTGAINPRGLAETTWHGCALNSPGWDNPWSRVLALTLGGKQDQADLHIMLNMDDQDLDFELPIVPGRRWHRAFDTALPSPEDAAEPGAEVAISGVACMVKGRSVVVLLSRDEQQFPGGSGARRGDTQRA